MKFILNTDTTPFEFKGSQKTFYPHRATILDETEYDTILSKSSLFQDCIDKGILVVSDVMRREWLPLDEQLNEANRINGELQSENNELKVKIEEKDKEIQKLQKELKKQSDKLNK